MVERSTFLHSYSASCDNWYTVGRNGECRVGEVRDGTTSPMPNRKGFNLQQLVSFQKFSTLRVKRPPVGFVECLSPYIFHLLWRPLSEQLTEKKPLNLLADHLRHKDVNTEPAATHKNKLPILLYSISLSLSIFCLGVKALCKYCSAHTFEIIDCAWYLWAVRLWNRWLGLTLIARDIVWLCHHKTAAFTNTYMGLHCAKKPVTTMLTYPWKCTVLHCNHLGNTWKPLVLMTQHFDYCPSASENSRKLSISRGRLAWWLLAFWCCVIQLCEVAVILAQIRKKGVKLRDILKSLVA